MKLAELTWPEIQRRTPDTPVVIPIAAVEQHGRHLPLWTDSLLLTEVLERVAKRMHDRLLLTPLMWLGNSDHHLDFGGTLSAPPRLYLDLLKGLCANLIHHGFRRIVLVNGHGGNDVPAKQALFELRQEHRQRSDLLLAMTTYWGLGTKPWLIDESIVQREMGHACEWETSMVLRAAPHLVGDYRAAADVAFGRGLEPGYRGWITNDRSEVGHIGQPRLATADKGEVLFSAFANDVSGWLERIVRWDGRSWDV